VPEIARLIVEILARPLRRAKSESPAAGPGFPRQAYDFPSRRRESECVNASLASVAILRRLKGMWELVRRVTEKSQGEVRWRRRGRCRFLFQGSSALSALSMGLNFSDPTAVLARDLSFVASKSVCAASFRTNSCFQVCSRCATGAITWVSVADLLEPGFPISIAHKIGRSVQCGSFC
jgi:hypothetical protein